MEFINRMLGLKKTERWGQEFQKLIDRLKNLKKRSRKWSDQDLRDIVEAVYLLNDKMLKLHYEIRKIRRKINDMSTSKMQISHYSPHHRSPNINPPHSMLEDQEAIANARENVSNRLEALKRFVKNYDQVVRLMDVNKDEAIAQLTKIKKPLSKYEIQFDDLNNSEAPTLRKYEDMLRKLKEFQPYYLATHLCILADRDARELPQTGQNTLNIQLSEFMEYMGLEYIDPSPGERYNKNDHKILEKNMGNGHNRGRICKVLDKGLRIIRSGKVIHPAKVSIWD